MNSAVIATRVNRISELAPWISIGALTLQAVSLRLSLNRWPMPHQDSLASRILSALDLLSYLSLLAVILAIPIFATTLLLCDGKSVRITRFCAGCTCLAGLYLLDPYGFISWWCD